MSSNDKLCRVHIHMDILTSAKQETPMRWKLIETFRAVMLTRSMTVAAHDLHTSQPNVSRAIGQLEEMVGFPCSCGWADA